MTRRTFWPLNDKPLGWWRVEIPERQIYAAHDPEQVIGYYREVMARRIVQDLEERGYTTHPDIIKDHGAWHLDQDTSRFGIGYRAQFPPASPAPGEGLEFENGKYAGTWGTVPDTIRVDTGGEFSDPIPTTYEPAGFNTATGNWVYRTI